MKAESTPSQQSRKSRYHDAKINIRKFRLQRRHDLKAVFNIADDRRKEYRMQQRHEFFQPWSNG